MRRAKRKMNRHSEREKQNGNISRAEMCKGNGVSSIYFRDKFKLRRTNTHAIYLTEFSQYIFSSTSRSLHKLSSAIAVTLKALSPWHM